MHQVSRDQYGSRERGVGVAQLLREHGWDINMQDENHTTLSHFQFNFGPVQIAQGLLDDSTTNVNASNTRGETLSYQELEGKSHIQCDPVLHSVH